MHLKAPGRPRCLQAQPVPGAPSLQHFPASPLPVPMRFLRVDCSNTSKAPAVALGLKQRSLTQRTCSFYTELLPLPSVPQQLTEPHGRSTHVAFPSSSTLPNLPGTQLPACCCVGKTHFRLKILLKLRIFLHAVCTVQLTALVLIHLALGTLQGSYAFSCPCSCNEQPGFALVADTRFQVLQRCAVPVTAVSHPQHSSPLRWEG